jgi:hypothetical protein
MISYDGHDGYACPVCGGKAMDVDFEAQPDLACLCLCHAQDNRQFFLDYAKRSAAARRREGLWREVVEFLESVGRLL